MNATEARYADLLNLDPNVEWFQFEGWKFRLASGAYYCPDFIVMRADGALEAVEIKGFWREAARVRIKVAADVHFPVKFKAVKFAKGVWSYEEF